MDTQPYFTLIEENDGYWIVWCMFDKDSEIGRRYDVWGNISLPYFVVGEDIEKFKKTGELDLSEINLLVGLIMRYSAIPPFSVTHKVKPYFKDILKDILSRHKINPPLIIPVGSEVFSIN